MNTARIKKEEHFLTLTVDELFSQQALSDTISRLQGIVTEYSKTLSNLHTTFYSAYDDTQEINFYGTRDETDVEYNARMQRAKQAEEKKRKAKLSKSSKQKEMDMKTILRLSKRYNLDIKLENLNGD